MPPTTGLALDFRARPSAAAYMLRALYPRARRAAPPFPPLAARWHGAGPDPARLEAFRRATGLGADGQLPLLYPQLLTFPLQMVILTHPACPLPIWKVLQVRNRLQQHRPIPAGASYDAEAGVAEQRVLERGLELDLRVTVTVAGELAWEGVTTYAYRGRFGQAGPASPLAAAPAEPSQEVAAWRTEPGGGLQFSGISGDYNGIHYWGAYARRFGFRDAFHHPHALVGQCLARLGQRTAPARRLDLWLKGPVYYASEVALAARADEASLAFALKERYATRPALLGRWS
jgi:hypothetical protein